ncbi:M20/M25/M40 family metallo-hydrolase [Sandarakinorhabdus sp.]|uniref:M20/M25/M40 family metallo-hydrolase n=1 Tax=Sandarakinorhabdus sp. TaxID=1916663 RepID=UPI00286E4652|nr:M20/M25/M40 family metallo-hydrolase [Sandarakinorhabdus sp.]
MRHLLTAALLAATAISPALAADRPDQTAFRALYKELVETNTSHSIGDCTLAANRMAARLKAAGFADAELNVFVPEGLPLDGGLIATFAGSDAKKGAVMLLAHLDVVEARREDWTRDPFTLIEEGGYFYGRGTADDKAQAAIWTDTLVRLKASGAKPKRTLKMVLSCGEESMPRINNIRWLIEKHPEWIKADFALNEGGSGALKPDGSPLALGFQAGEKVTQNFQIEATNPGGHSSVPRPDNAITALATALARIGPYEFPIRFNEVTRGTFTALAGITPGPMGAAMKRLVANPDDKEADAIVSKDPRFHSMLRTTCVATLLEGGHAINALPQRARASVNCRMFPSDDPKDIQAQLERAIGDAPVKVTTLPPVNPVNPPPPLTDEVFGTATRIAAKHWPGVPIVPTMSTGATDGRFLIPAGIPTYGVPGAFSEPGTNAHGLNERISVKGLMAERDYLFDLVKAYAGVK